MSDETPHWPDLLDRLRKVPPEEDAWQVLYGWLEREARKVLKGWQGLESEGAEDLAQQTLIKLLEHASALARLDASRSPDAYLKTAIRNAAHDIARRRILALKALQHLAEQGSRQAPDRTPEADDQLETIRRAVDRLSDDQRELLRLRFWEGLAVGEIADKLGLNYSAVAVRLFRVLQKLRIVLDVGSH